MQHSTYLIVGAGHAGIVAARKIRSIRPEDSILLIGEENMLPYERPALSKEVLSGHRDVSNLVIRSAEALESERLDVLLDDRVEAIIPDRKMATTKSGRHISYEKLLIATGSRPRHLPLEGLFGDRVHYLRTASDALRLRAHLGPKTRLLIIGAGSVGLEVAATARAHIGCDVTVLEAGPHILGRGAPDALRQALSGLHRLNGVNILTHTTVAGVSEGDGSGMAVMTAGGAVHTCDVILVCIGAVPNEELARDAGIATDGGILTDAFGRTSLPDIWAAGEVARHRVPFLDAPVRFESWQMAQTQAAIVGANIAGETRPITYVPWFWTDQFGHNFQLLGELSAEADVHVLRGDGGLQATHLYHIGGQLVGALCIDDGKHVPPIRRALEKGQSIDLERLSDRSTKLAKAFL